MQLAMGKSFQNMQGFLVAAARSLNSQLDAAQGTHANAFDSCA